MPRIASNTANLVARTTGNRLLALQDVGYTGDYSWEDEPEARNPLAIASQMREWIEARV